MRKLIRPSEALQPDEHLQHCHWAKETDHRCQMLGTMGAGRESNRPGGETGTWYCLLHYFESHSHHRPELKSFDALLPWLMETARDYPESQWNDDPQRIWFRLRGEAKDAAVYEPYHPPAGDGEIPTREELNKILSRLKPGLYGDALKREAGYARTVEVPSSEAVADAPEEVRLAQAKRAAMLAEARSKGLIP